MVEPTPFARDGRPIPSLISAEEIAARVAELGRTITADYAEAGSDLELIGVLKGSIIFLADLCRQIALPIAIDFIGIASYGDQTQSSGVVQITSDLSRPIAGKHVIVVEDIIDTGLTAHYLLDNLATRHPASVKLCSLLHKPDRAERQVAIDYLGFTIPNKFVVGYGLDHAQRYRNLAYIGYLEEG
ncbi:MAG TPA: hypoxanthine phosphoribosyltransferase [Kofleriaceae bacterium]|nr:hypoxanthine phosphoribosyltransferase [Kofleriaceae bacterium]